MSTLAVVPKGKGHLRHFYSERSMMALVVRKSLSRTAARTVGAVALVDTSRQVICKAECKADAALYQNARCFHAFKALTAALTIIRTEQDATNTNVWRKNKVMNFVRQTISVDLECCSAMQSLMTKGLHPATWFDPAISKDQLTGDLLVPESGCAGHAAALFEKQLRSSGCPSIMDLVHLLHSRRTTEFTDFTVFMLASDGGPDQVKQKKHWQAVVEDAQSLLVFDLHCWFHVYSRQSEGHLRKVEDGVRAFPGVPLEWKYYPSLCKISQCSRDLAPEMYTMWGSKFGANAQHHRGRRMVPRPVATRWQSVGNTERHLLDANTENQFSRVLQDCLVQKVQKDDATPSLVAKAQPHEELTAEEMRAYSQKMGRWRKDTLHTIADPLFWQAVVISAKTRTVAEHMVNWMKGPADCADRPWLGGLHHTQFVCFKGAELSSSYFDLLDLHWLADSRTHLPDEYALWLTDFTVDLVLWNQSEFHRRFIAPISHFPDQLLWFVWSLHDSPCTHRQRVAQQLESMQGLDANARKILRKYGDDIEDARITGKCSFRFWMCIYAIASQWKSRSDLIEGLNSTVKAEAKKATRINLDLLSARLRLYARTGSISKSVFSWKTHARNSSVMLEDIMQHVDDAHSLLRDADRWTGVTTLPLTQMTSSQAQRVLGPSPFANVGEHTVDISDVPAGELDRCSRWAKKVANHIRTELRKCLATLAGAFPCSLCIMVGEDGATAATGGDRYVYLPTHLKQLLCLRCSHPKKYATGPNKISREPVRLDMVIRTLYTQTMTAMDIGKSSKKRKAIEDEISISFKRVHWVDGGVGHVSDHTYKRLPSLTKTTAASAMPARRHKGQGREVQMPLENGMPRSLESELGSVVGDDLPSEIEEQSECDGDDAVYVEDGVNHAHQEIQSVHAQLGGAGDAGDIGVDDLSTAHAREEAALAVQLQEEHPDLALRQHNLDNLQRLECMEEYVTTYSSQLSDGWDAFQAAVSSAGVAPGHHGCMSLVKYRDRIDFFHWIHDQVNGRLARLDNDNRPIWPVSSMSDPIQHDELDIIAPSVGTRCIMIAGPRKPGDPNHRPKLNPCFLELKMRCECVYNGGHIAALHPFCQLCNTQGEHDLVSCIMCMTTFHAHCMSQMPPAACDQLKACHAQLLGRWRPDGQELYRQLNRMGTSSMHLCCNCKLLADACIAA
jgi:hypothetical protein